MTVLEGNQSYRAAMTILKTARMALLAENDDATYYMLVHASYQLTEQEHRDMKASFAHEEFSAAPIAPSQVR
jgi:hydrogenase maturation factor